jgi:hypothetical protein
MTDLKVVNPGATAKPEGLHVRISYDGDSGHGAIYDGETYLASTSFFWVKTEGSWPKVRKRVLQNAAERVAVFNEFGAPPASETVLAAELPEVKAKDD